MSRFIKYASNLLDGVDSMAKDSLTDQDIAAAAAAERRRRRRELKRRSQQGGGGGSAAEPSEGDLSADSSQWDAAGPGRRGARASSGAGSGVAFGHGGRPLPYGGSFDEGGSTAEEDYGGRGGGGRPGEGGQEGQRQQHRPWSSADSPGPSPRPYSRTAAPAGEGAVGLALPPPAAAAAAAYPSSGGEDTVPAAAATTPSAAAGPAAASSMTPRKHPSALPHRYLQETPGLLAGEGGGGAPGKEDGSVWSDKGTISSAAPSPLGRGRGISGDHLILQHHLHGDDDGDDANSETPGPSQRRPPPLEGGLVGGAAGVMVGDGRGDGEEEGRGRGSSITVSNASMHAHANLSPAVSPFGRQRQHLQQQQQQQQQVEEGDEEDGAAAPSPQSARFASPAVAGDGGGGGGGGAGGGSSRERGVLGGLLGIGGRSKKGQRGGRRGDGDSDDEDPALEELRAEAKDLRAEVEELGLELEGAEDRLRGQEEELQTAAEELKCHKEAAAERESEMEAEMEQFRELQLQEKKVFLANLAGVERALKEKEREIEEARTALSGLEAFAMEREDAVTKLQHQNEELLEELKGARSGQDRSAEEVREALTRAEAEAEEVETRHRQWMRQAQARQTELEATAAQLAEALAEANRQMDSQAAAGAAATDAAAGEEGDGDGARRGGGSQGGGSGGRGAKGSDRELRALGDELHSCQASLELEQERTRSLHQEISLLRQDLDAARASEAVVERQRQEHVKMAAESFAKATRLEEQLQQEKASAKRLGAAAPTPSGPESQIQSLSSKLLDKQARLEESVRERNTLKAKLRETTDRAFRAEQELREFRGESLESGGVEAGGGGGVGGGVMRARRGRSDRLGGGRGSASGTWSRLGPIAKHKKIATAVDVLDRHTVQAVVFLRNSSVARAVFLAYLLLLHFWAFAIVSFHSSTLNHMKHPAELSGNDNHGHD